MAPYNRSKTLFFHTHRPAVCVLLSCCLLSVGGASHSNNNSNGALTTTTRNTVSHSLVEPSNSTFSGASSSHVVSVSPWLDTSDSSSSSSTLFIPNSSLSSRNRRAPSLPAGVNNPQREIRKTAYVCENGTLNLSCVALKNGQEESGVATPRHIDVLRANFGRFSITLCNPSGQLDWSVNCASSNSLPVLIERCSNRVECSVPASSQLFGDPCPSTSKYLEVHYRCSSGQSSGAETPSGSAELANSRHHPFGSGLPQPHSPLPPPLLPPTLVHIGKGRESSEISLPSSVRVPMHSSIPRPSEPVASSSSSSSQHSSSLSSSSSVEDNPFEVSTSSLANQDLLFNSNQLNKNKNNNDSGCNQRAGSHDSTRRECADSNDSSHKSNLNTPVSGSTWTSTRNSQTVHLPTIGISDVHNDQTNVAQNCPPVIYRHIEWPSAVMGATVSKSCPESTSGIAKWTCRGPKWHALPDLSQCVASWLHQLLEMKNPRQMQRSDIWKSILTRAERSAFLSGGDVIALTELLHDSLTDVIQKTDHGVNNNQGVVNILASVSQHHLVALETVFELISFLLERDNSAAWLDLSSEERDRNVRLLLDSIVEFSVLHCLDARHFHNERELIRESKFQLISCLSLTRAFYELKQQHQQQHQPVKQDRASFEIFNSRPFNHLLPFTNVSVFMSARMADLHAMVNENRFVGVVLSANVGQYFSVNYRRTLELNLDENMLRVINTENAEDGGDRRSQRKNEQFDDNNDGMQFINSNAIRLFEFNQTHLLTPESVAISSNTDPEDGVQFEIHFQHWIDSEMLKHECIHATDDNRKWSNEHCWIVSTNASHTVCRCRQLLSTVALLAYDTDNSNNRHHFSKHSKSSLASSSLLSVHHWFQNRPGGVVLSLVLLTLSWIGILLTRWQNGFLSRLSLALLLLVCIVRTCIELVLIAGQSLMSSSTTQFARQWSSFVEFAALYQMGVICSLLGVFVCQNVILVALSARIFLARNYSTVVRTLNKSKRLQIFISFTFPLIYLATLSLLVSHNNSENYSVHAQHRQQHPKSSSFETFGTVESNNNNNNFAQHQTLWPDFSDLRSPLAYAFVLGPFIQILLIVLASLTFVHCCQKFAHYGYPNLHTFRYDTSEVETYVKNLFCHRCKYLTLWTGASLAYVALILVPLTIGLAVQELSWTLVCFDVALILSLALLIQPKRLARTLLYGVEGSSSKSLPSGTIAESSSISVVSDSGKCFLSGFPGQMARILDSPKIYPNAGVNVAGVGVVGHRSHQSSSASYESGSGSDPSSHLYESPKNLFANSNTGNKTKSAAGFDIYGRRRESDSIEGVGFHTTTRLQRPSSISQNYQLSQQQQPPLPPTQHGLYTLRDNSARTPQYSYGFTSVDNELHPDISSVVNYHTNRLSRPSQSNIYYAYDRDPYNSRN